MADESVQPINGPDLVCLHQRYVSRDFAEFWMDEQFNNTIQDIVACAECGFSFAGAGMRVLEKSSVPGIV